MESVKLIWGGDSVMESTRTEWVEYGDDNTSRSIVDFDNGSIVVEVALDEGEALNEALVSSRLAEAVERVLGSCGSTHPYSESGDAEEAVSEVPILDGIVDLSAYRLADGAEGNGAVAPSRKTPPAPTAKSGTLNLPTAAPRPKPVAANGGAVAERRQQGAERVASLLEQREQAREQARAKAAKKQEINVKVNGASATVNVAAAAAAVPQ